MPPVLRFQYHVITHPSLITSSSHPHLPFCCLSHSAPVSINVENTRCNLGNIFLGGSWTCQKSFCCRITVLIMPFSQHCERAYLCFFRFRNFIKIVYIYPRGSKITWLKQPEFSHNILHLQKHLSLEKMWWNNSKIQELYRVGRQVVMQTVVNMAFGGWTLHWE